MRSAKHRPKGVVEPSPAPRSIVGPDGWRHAQGAPDVTVCDQPTRQPGWATHAGPVSCPACLDLLAEWGHP